MAEKVWFYLFAGKEYGPVDEIKIRELMDLKVIDGNTKVWRQGMTHWEKLATTDLAEVLRQLNISTNPEPVPELGRRKPPFPRKEFHEDYKKWFITFFFLVGESVVTFALLLFKVPITRIIYTSLACVFTLPILINMVLSLVLLYKYWEIIQDGYASTSPAKAVGFLFIPVFNIYWTFRTYWHLSKDLNRYQHALPPEAQTLVIHSKEWLSLLFAILSLVVTVFRYSMRIFLAIETNKSIVFYFLGSLPLPTWYSISANLAILILTVIHGLVYIDLFRSTDSILKTQEIA